MVDRSGPGGKAYRRLARALRHRTGRDNLPCAWCGEAIDIGLPPNHARAFTADHVEPLANGGALLGELQPMHRDCNARKGKTVAVRLRDASI